MGWIWRAGAALILAACTQKPITTPRPAPVQELYLTYSIQSLSDSERIRQLPLVIAEELREDSRVGNLDTIIIHTDPQRRKENACNFRKDFAWSGLHCGNTIVLAAGSGRDVVVHEIAHQLYDDHPNRHLIAERFDSIHAQHGRSTPYMNFTEQELHMSSQDSKLPARFLSADSLCAAGFLTTHAAKDYHEDVATLIETARTKPTDLLRCQEPAVLQKIAVLTREDLVPKEINQYLALARLSWSSTTNPDSIAERTFMFAQQYPSSRYTKEAIREAARMLEYRNQCAVRDKFVKKVAKLPLRNYPEDLQYHCSYADRSLEMEYMHMLRPRHLWENPRLP